MVVSFSFFLAGMIRSKHFDKLTESISNIEIRLPSLGSHLKPRSLQILQRPILMSLNKRRKLRSENFLSLWRQRLKIHHSPFTEILENKLPVLMKPSRELRQLASRLGVLDNLIAT
jgi:hypothetical protein